MDTTIVENKYAGTEILENLEKALKKIVESKWASKGKNYGTRKKHLDDWFKKEFASGSETHGDSDGIVLMDLRKDSDDQKTKERLTGELNRVASDGLHGLLLAESDALPDDFEGRLKALWNGTLCTLLLVRYEKSDQDQDWRFEYKAYNYKSEQSSLLDFYDEQGFDIEDTDRGIFRWLYMANADGGLPEDLDEKWIGLRVTSFNIRDEATAKNLMEQSSPEGLKEALDKLNLSALTKSWLYSFLSMRKGDIVYSKELPNIINRWSKVSSECKYYVHKNESYIYREIENWYPKGNGGTNIIDVKSFNKFIIQNIDESLWKNIDETLKINPVETPTTLYYRPYDKNKFLDDVYINKNTYYEIVELLKEKKNIILQGPPGVGKTFMAKRLAWSIMGKKDNTRIRFVQFHQNYSYEDFILGWRPVASSSESNDPALKLQLQYGPFYTLCEEAKGSPDEYFLIIDEINRGNVSKIFGELLMLIEHDKRSKYGVNDSEKGIRLLYEDKLFSVPDNIYIIGMMNTADRSLALIDYALRRRFAFVDIVPALDSIKGKINSKKFDAIINAVQKINKTISEDPSLGSGFCIGHSYLCLDESIKDKQKIAEKLERIVKYTLKPLLREYWYDDETKRKGAERDLDAALTVSDDDNWHEQTKAMQTSPSGASAESSKTGDSLANVDSTNAEHPADLEEV